MKISVYNIKGEATGRSVELPEDIFGIEPHEHSVWLDVKRYLAAQRQGDLDLVAGLAVNNVGHRHPRVVQAIKDQCDRYLHVIPYGEFVQEPQVRYAERLTELLPAGLDSVYFVNSGTEANEAALKLAKRVTGRTRIIACHNARVFDQNSQQYNTAAPPKMAARMTQVSRPS